MTARNHSRNRVVGLAALASDEDGAVDLRSTRRPRAKAAAAETVLRERRRGGNIKKMSSTCIGCDVSLDEGGQALSEITTSLRLSLQEGEFDIATTIKGAGYYRRSRQSDFVSDYLPPTPDEIEKVIDSLRILNFATDPVILSTLPDGNIVRGLAGLPREGPAVIVGYHMLMTLESLPMVAGVLRSTGINFRGLGHPLLFDENTEQLMPDSSLFDVYRILGAVPVTSLNFYKLLSEKHFVLLYPGGAREALHRKGEEYKLFWPEQPEFVRMASRFRATIIPFGVVGEDDICEILLDYDDLWNLPFYDIIDKELNRDSVKLREDSPGEVNHQAIHPIVVSPKVPGRFYFIFGKPIETRGREKELREKESAQHLYLHVKSEAESCIKYLKEKREEDPYRSILSRLLYQAVNGWTAEIPTFEP
ncbi:hypothetical protein ACQ4PT_052927 [Festuca glaucescens]